MEYHADPTPKDLTVNYKIPSSLKTFTEKSSPIGVELFDEFEAKLSKTLHVSVVEDSKAINIDSTAALIEPPLADSSATFFFQKHYCLLTYHCLESSPGARQSTWRVFIGFRLHV